MKIGDRVKVIADIRSFKDKIGRISKIDPDMSYPYLLYFEEDEDFHAYRFEARELELIESS